MRKKFTLLGILLLLVCGVSASRPGRVQAEAPAQTIVSTIATVVRIIPLDPQPLGKPILATAVLTDVSAKPISNATVNFLIGNSFVAQSKTNSQGQAQVTIKSDFASGSYDLRAVYLGGRQYDVSNGKTSLIILPTMLTIQTVPPMEGIQFKLADQTFSSGPDGIARLQVNRTGDYTLQVLGANPSNASIRVDFYRWSDESYQPYRDIHIPQSSPIQAGFQLSYKVGQTFIDLQNKPVDTSRITLMTLKSSQGTTYNFVDGTARWLPASLITRRATGLEIVPIQYSVITVLVDGSNVVSSEQQRFYPHIGDVWPIQLLLFSAQFSGRDAILGTPVGIGIQLDYPNGDSNKFFFGKDRTVTINSLARGIYHVQVIGVNGLAPSTPVALSQNQVMAISVLSRLDIFAGVTLACTFGLGLIVIGRTQILENRRNRRRSSPVTDRSAVLNSVPERREG